MQKVLKWEALVKGLTAMYSLGCKHLSLGLSLLVSKPIPQCQLTMHVCMQMQHHMNTFLFLILRVQHCLTCETCGFYVLLDGVYTSRPEQPLLAAAVLPAWR